MPFVKFWNLAPDHSDKSVLNMYVYGEIKSASSFFGSEDDVVAGEFVKDLDKYPDAKTINLYINSPGGSVFAAAAIRNQLRNRKALVCTWCEGICASAAVGLLLAASPGQRHMSNASLLMIHNPSTSAQGDQQTFIKTADLLAKVKGTILNMYQEGTGLSREQLSAMMDADTYLDSDEALLYRFVDHITEDKVDYNFTNEGGLICNGVNMDVAAEVDMTDLQAHLQQIINKKSQKEGGSQIMPFETFMNSLSNEQRTALQQEITNQITAAVTAKATALEAEHAMALAALQAANTDLNNTVATMKNQLAALENKPTTDDPEAAIKKLPVEAQMAIAQARADAVAARAELSKIQDAQKFAEFKASFAEFDKLPIQDAHITALQMLAKNNEQMYNDLRELLKVANTAMGTSFQAQGSDNGTEQATTAYAVMDQRVQAYMTENKGSDYATAMRAVLAADPALYESYRNAFRTGAVE